MKFADKRDLASGKVKVVIVDTVAKNRKVKNTVFLFLGNSTNSDRIIASKVPSDSVLTVKIDVTVIEISNRIFSYNMPDLGKRCIDRRNANMLT
jgi:uncharacterized membrane protein